MRTSFHCTARAAIAAILASAGATAQDLPKDERFDKSMGVDVDGRIDRPELPDDLPNPERWRYVPEGRLIEGNVFKRLWVSSFVVPTVFSEPDIGVGGGLALTDIDFRNQRRREFAGAFLSYTTEGQQRYRLLWRRFTDHRELDEGGVLVNERAFWQASGGYERTLTRRFYGLGADTREQDETSYTDEVTAFAASRQWTLDGPAGDWISRLGAAFEYHNLASGVVGGVPSSEQVFPELVAAGDGQALLFLNADIEWNTRDSQHSPHRGTTAGVTVRFAPAQTGGDVGALFGAEATHVLPIPSPFHNGGDGDEENPPTDAIAIGLLTAATAGDLPFYKLPSLGGPNTLRGYVNNRFTDRAAWHASAEWRFWFWPRGFEITERVRIERVGAVLFYDVGSVADQWTDAFRATARDSYGFGFRFHLERLALFRVDIGFSDEGTNFTINYGLPF